MSDLEGEWVNQNGSTLFVDSVVKSLVTGRFISQKGRAAADQIYPIIGCVNEEIVTFTVDFTNESTNLRSISNFTGRLEGDRLHTIWVLARAFQDAEQTVKTQAWNTFLVNSDVFKRVPVA